MASGRSSGARQRQATWPCRALRVCGAAPRAVRTTWDTRTHLSSGPSHQGARPQACILRLGDSEARGHPAPPPPAHSQAAAHLTNAAGNPTLSRAGEALPRAFL